jgi:collagenase-like PrtC family protease
LNTSTVPAILAPAGGKQQFLAALNAGADEVYLGLRSFSARASANNFSHDDLCELLPLARRYDMKVFLAFNTVIAQSELQTAFRQLAKAFWLGIDALIVQDPGIASAVHKVLPDLPLHASTQMAVHDLRGARHLARLGFRRIVLAREMTLSEIETTTAELHRMGVETEVFCHGSLCYSMSGLCLFGGVIEQRSGNRGLCPYPCRRLYSTPAARNSEPRHLFNMRDLETELLIPDLVGTGVDSLKIEGRKKDAQYVATTIAKYRIALDRHFNRPTLRPKAPEGARQNHLAELVAAEARYSFQRTTTSLFLDEKKVTLSLDQAQPTHTGVPCARNLRLMPNEIQFTTIVPIESHDGLILEIGSWSQGFACPPLRQQGRLTHHAAGATAVSMELPFEIPETVRLSVGKMEPHAVRLLKVRSANLRALVERTTKPPPGERIRPLRPLALRIGFSHRGGDQPGESPSLTIRSGWKGRNLPPFSTPLLNSGTINPERGTSLDERLQGLFSILGDAQCECLNVTVESSEYQQCAPSQGDLKQAKRQFAQWIVGAFAQEENLLADELLRTSMHDSSSSRATILSERASQSSTLPTLVCTTAPIRTHLELLAELQTTQVLRMLPSLALEPNSVMVIEDLAAQWRSRFQENPLIQLPALSLDFPSSDWLTLCRRLLASGHNRFVTSSYWHLDLLREIAPVVPLEIHLSYLLPTWNLAAFNAHREAGAVMVWFSPEETSANQRPPLCDHPVGPFAAPFLYGYPPLFTSRNCPFAKGRCKKETPCLFPGNRSCEVIDNQGNNYILRANSRCHNNLFSLKPYNALGLFPTLRASGFQTFVVDLALWSEAGDETLRRLKSDLTLIRTIFNA